MDLPEGGLPARVCHEFDLDLAARESSSGRMCRERWHVDLAHGAAGTSSQARRTAVGG